MMLGASGMLPTAMFGTRRSSLLKALHVHVSDWLFEMFELTFVLGQ